LEKNIFFFPTQAKEKPEGKNAKEHANGKPRAKFWSNALQWPTSTAGQDPKRKNLHLPREALEIRPRTIILP
jgi:hypothetical protein